MARVRPDSFVWGAARRFIFVEMAEIAAAFVQPDRRASFK